MGKRQPNFTADEMETLTTGVENRAKLLFGTLGGATTAAAKDNGWEAVTKEVNAVGGHGRVVKDIRRKWIVVKSETKGKMAGVKKERQKTGGGACEGEGMSLMENRILGVVGEVSVNGIVGGVDSTETLLRHMLSEYEICCYFVRVRVSVMCSGSY